MFDVIALVCALGQDPRDCQPPTARTVAKVGETSSEMSCIARSQLDAAKLPPVGVDEYVKTICRRREE